MAAREVPPRVAERGEQQERVVLQVVRPQHEGVGPSRQELRRRAHGRRGEVRDPAAEVGDLLALVEAPGLDLLAAGDLLVPGRARNHASKRIRGEHVANFDDDNVYAPTYLEAMVRRLDASGAGLVSLDEAWVATLAGAAANGADSCRRLGGFHARGETFVHRNVALAAAAYAPLNVGEEVGLLTALPNTAVVDDVGLFLHVEHGRNTVDFELLDGREEDVAFTQLTSDLFQVILHTSKYMPIGSDV